MSPRSKKLEGRAAKVWALLNSPLVLTLISAGFIGLAWKVWDIHREDERDFASRKAVYSKLLTEYRHRMNALAAADDSLGWAFDSHGPSAPKIDLHDPAMQARWDRESASAGRAETDVLAGRGSYVPTSPDYAGVSLLTLADEIEEATGTPDPMVQVQRLLGFLDAPPKVLWLYVHAERPMLETFGRSREVLAMTGELPLRHGSSLTSRQEQVMGIPTGTAAEVAAMKRGAMVANDRLVADLQPLDAKAATAGP